MKRKRVLIIDFANFYHLIKHKVSNNIENILDDNKSIKNYFIDTIILMVSNYIDVLKGEEAILTLESRSWRKTYYPLYKSNRKYDEPDELTILFNEAMEIAIEFFKDYTNLKVIKVDGAEGDDIIAVLSQKLASEGNDVVIISTDGDFKQLLKYNHIRIFNPIKKVYDTHYSKKDYITKLIKGDSGDGIPSSYPRIKNEIIDKIVLDEKYLEAEFEENKRQRKRQKYYLSKILDLDERLINCDDDIYEEIINSAKKYRETLKNKVKEAREWNEYNDDEKLKLKDKKIKEIIKSAKKDGLTEAKLFGNIIPFKKAFERNKKLISLDIDNLPPKLVENIIKEYNKSHKATKQQDFLKFIRKYKLKEFAFSNEWKVLKNVK
jgi:hypothetical protein